MKQLLVLAGLLSLLMASTASAGERYWRGNSGYLGLTLSSHNYFPGPYRYRGGGFHRGWYGGGFGRRYRPFVSYRRYDRHRLDSGALLGGLVIGSVIGQSIASSRYETGYGAPYGRYARPVPVRSGVRVIRRSSYRAASQPARRLLRDLEGRCFEITRTGAGREVRTELEPSACNY